MEVQRHQGQGQRPGVAAKPGIARGKICGSGYAVAFGGRCLRRQCRFRQGLKSTLPNNCAHVLEPKSYDMPYILAATVWGRTNLKVAGLQTCYSAQQPTNLTHPPTRLPTHQPWNPPTHPSCRIAKLVIRARRAINAFTGCAFSDSAFTGIAMTGVCRNTHACIFSSELHSITPASDPCAAGSMSPLGLLAFSGILFGLLFGRWRRQGEEALRHELG